MTHPTPVGEPAWQNGPRPREPFRGPLSAWLEQHVTLPEGLVDQPGPLHLFPYQTAIADAMADPWLERVTVVKPVRVGYSMLLIGAIAYFMREMPSPILVVLPVESDCRDFLVSDIEPFFEASAALKGVLPMPSRAPADRNRLTHRMFPGGSLKIVSARAPRNLRRHSSKYLLLDECDGFEFGTGKKSEGDPIKLAERRTLSFSGRRIIAGSTPLYTDTSPILKLYEQSDCRIYECPCPSCGAFTEILWQHIEWQPDQPHTASFRCPHCDELVPESYKAEMVKAGHWRATNPTVRGHAGFRLNALISGLVNASWSKLAAEFLQVKHDPEQLRVFINTILAQGYRIDGTEGLDGDTLQSRAERFDLANIPPEVLSLTCGIDVQHDRLECTIAGWTRTNDCLVLEHRILHGSPNDDPDLRADLDDLLLARFQHPNGGRLKIDATVIDCADGATHNKIVGFCAPRTSRKVLAGRGASGFHRAPISRSLNRKARLGKQVWIIGVDALKQQLFNKLSAGRSIRFSDTLPAEWYEQLTSERRVVRYVRGKPTARFERIVGMRAESLDCLIYATAARGVVNLAIDTRERDLASPIPPVRAAPAVIQSKFMSQGRL